MPTDSNKPLEDTLPRMRARAQLWAAFGQHIQERRHPEPSPERGPAPVLESAGMGISTNMNNRRQGKATDEHEHV